MVYTLRAKPSLVPRPLPDFISQPWRKIFLHGCEIKSGSGLGTRLGEAHSVYTTLPSDL